MAKRNKRRELPTKETAERFFDALDDNEEIMGEGAALAVTLEQFGYGDHENDVLGDMAEALVRGQ